MNTKELENRLSILEAEFALLKSKVEKKEETKKPWWEEIAGTFADDPIYDEAMRLGREYRLSQREDYDKDED
jgi:hypothetical protein